MIPPATRLDAPTATLRFFRERLLRGQFELLPIPDSMQEIAALAAVYHAEPDAPAAKRPFVRLPEMDAWLIIWRQPLGTTQAMLCPPHLQIVDYHFDPHCDFFCLGLMPTTIARWGLPVFHPADKEPRAVPELAGALRRIDRRLRSWDACAHELLREVDQLPRIAVPDQQLCMQTLYELSSRGPACRITELAEAVGLNQRKLNRVFTSVTGWPLKDWRRGERITRTLIEWWHGRDLQDLERLGWSDSSHLYRECRNLFGCGQRRLRLALDQHRTWAQAWHLPADALQDAKPG